VVELAQRVTAELGIAAAEAVVDLALEQLGRRHLLDEAPRPLAPAARVGRREALKQLAAATVALPLVLTIVTRAAAQSASGNAEEDPSTTPAVQLSVPITVTITPPPPKTPTGPCRKRGQSCLASTSGQQGTCCAGLVCNGVASGAGVCG
jgi:hypothetical protein